MEVKKKAEADAANNEALEEFKKKAARDMDNLLAQLEEAHSQNERVDKSRKKLQSEVRR